LSSDQIVHARNHNRPDHGRSSVGAQRVAPGLLWKFRPIVSRASRKRLQVRDPDLGQEVRGLELCEDSCADRVSLHLRMSDIYTCLGLAITTQSTSGVSISAMATAFLLHIAQHLPPLDENSNQWTTRQIRIRARRASGRDV